ncbi:histidinol-phosphatase HisJ [Gorillibacterium sp. sgz500922]|uniref:histidinol-phosphatase HisJ n=1 Tax=Gorillibacterium sp. sgz500922 TaxID=3446694 RepID=UPI003F6745F1
MNSYESLLKWNGHTHTNFCRHGSPAPMEAYLEEALKHGFERYTISEHPPLPAGWIPDEPLMRELAMREEELPGYMEAALGVKRRYEGRLDIRVGLELDYLEGNTGYSERLLEQTEGRLDDLLVSVHYLRGRGGMRSIDYTPQDFRDNLLSYYGSMEAVVGAYFDQVEQAVEWAGSLSCGKRLGHVNLIRKFQTALPAMDPGQLDERLRKLVPALKRYGIGLDVNTAGFRVPTCGEAYVPGWLLAVCREEGIPFVFGSDAHKPEDVGSGWEWFARTVRTEANA